MVFAESNTETFTGRAEISAYDVRMIKFATPLIGFFKHKVGKTLLDEITHLLLK